MSRDEFFGHAGHAHDVEGLFDRRPAILVDERGTLILGAGDELAISVRVDDAVVVWRRRCSNIGMARLLPSAVLLARAAAMRQVTPQVKHGRYLGRLFSSSRKSRTDMVKIPSSS